MLSDQRIEFLYFARRTAVTASRFPGRSCLKKGAGLFGYC